MNKQKRHKFRMLFDATVGVITLILFAVCHFFWECKLDLEVTIFGIVVVVFGTIMLEIQDNKIDKE